MTEYNRKAAIEYAKKWAFSRNPKYYAFDKLGGDCTNFISQCLYAGSKIMNYTPTFGWYYINSTQRSPSWTGVQYLYNFLISNTGPGPFGEDVDKSKVNIGDIIQLGNYNSFYHSLLIVDISDSKIFVSAHDFNAYHKDLNEYIYDVARFIHIVGINGS